MNLSIEEIQVGSEAYRKALKLREEILRAPLGLEFGPEDAEADRLERHFVARSEGGDVVACCLFRKREDQWVKLRQMAVAESWRKRGVGARLIQGALDQGILSSPNRGLFCHARDEAAGFYERLGFFKVGEPFLEVGILHHRMELREASVSKGD